MKHDIVERKIGLMGVLVILVALIKPLTAALGREDGMATMRVVVMMLSTATALFYFIKSFIDVRRARAAAEAQNGN